MRRPRQLGDLPECEKMVSAVTSVVRDVSTKGSMSVSFRAIRRSYSLDVICTLWANDENGLPVQKHVMLWFERASGLPLPLSLLGQTFTSERGRRYKVIGLVSAEAKKYPVLAERLDGGKKQGTHYALSVMTVQRGFGLQGFRTDRRSSLSVPSRVLLEEDSDALPGEGFEEVSDDRAIELEGSE